MEVKLFFKERKRITLNEVTELKRLFLERSISMINNNFFVREPLLPISYFFNEVIYREDEQILDLLKQEKLAKAIKLSSPNFYNQINSLSKKNEKTRSKICEKIFNYASRATLRPTPFGMFCSVGKGYFNEKASQESNSLSDFELFININTEWISELVFILHGKKEVLRKLTFKFNSRILIENNNIIIIESKKKNNSRMIEISEPLKVLLKQFKGRNSFSYDEMLKLLKQKFQTNDNDIENFTKEILINKIIFSNLSPSFPYNKTFDSILEFLNKNISKNEAIILSLNDLNKRLKNKDFDINNAIELMKTITPNYHGDYFHIDSRRSEITIFDNIQKNKIIKFEKFFQRFMESELVYSPLNKIKDFFYNNYNINDEIPLLEFLYSEASLKNLSLEMEIKVNEKVREKLRILNNWIDKKIMEDHTVIKVDKDLINELDRINSKNEIAIQRDYCLVLNSHDNGKSFSVNNYLTGCKIDSLLGRFYYLFNDNTLENQIENNTSILNADIVTWSDTTPKINNLFSSSKIQKHSIICNNLNDFNNIDINDIYVGISNNTVYLKSKKLNKIIIPVQNNMVNLENEFTRIEQFLVAIKIQYESMYQSLFSINSFNRVMTPRIVYDKYILQKAKYYLKISDFKKNQISSFETFKLFFENWCKVYLVPKIIGINSQGDIQYLCVSNQNHLKYIYNLLMIRKEIQFEEFILNEDLISNDSKYKEYIFNFKNSTKITNIDFSEAILDKEYLSAFDYEDTLYYKLYSREIYADTIIKSLLTVLYKRFPNYQIFFIRYADPNFHIRIRILNTQNQKFIIANEFVSIIHDLGLIDSGIIYNYSMEVFVPEINRYGGRENISLIHTYFYYESKLVVELLTLFENDKEKLIAFCISFILFIYNSFYSSMYEIKSILKNIISKGKYNEKISRWIKKDIIDTARLKQECDILGLNTFDYFNALERISKYNVKSASKELLSNSLVHMFINRIGTTVELTENELNKIVLGIINKKIKSGE